MSGSKSKKGWSRSDKWTAVGVLLAAVSVIVSLAVPEIREHLGLHDAPVIVELKKQDVPTPSPPTTQRRELPQQAPVDNVLKGMRSLARREPAKIARPTDQGPHSTDPPSSGANIAGNSLEITGRVTDGKSGDGILNALVGLEGRDEKIFTSGTGSFTLALKPPLPRAPIRLTIAAENYIDFSSYVQPGQSLQVALKSEEVMLDPPYCQKYNRGLRHFYWFYIYDAVHDRRRKDWYQESATAWNECYSDGTHNHLNVVEDHANVGGNEGVICQGDDSAARIFIPNPDADGVYPKTLRYQTSERDKWGTLANMHVIK
jgi:hypothetical protein